VIPRARQISSICRWIAWPLLAVVIFVTLSPIGLRPVTAAPADLERFAAFAALGGMFCFGYPRHRFIALLSLVALAGALEALQHLVPTRHGRISDAAVKALGVATGVFVAERLASWCPSLFGQDV
jgi:VanZ family protein